MNKRYAGSHAFITGASSGLGAVFARQLARAGANVALVARSEDKLRGLANEIEAECGVRALAIPADLSREGEASRVAVAVAEQGFPVDLLVNNAGVGSFGLFETTSNQRQLAEIRLNVLAVVELTHALLGPMLRNGRGAIVNVASTAAFQPVPHMAVYGATKAFVLSFSEALFAENERRGIRVLALCPGATETGFFDAMGTRNGALGKTADPERVVQQALSALARKKSYVVPGFANYMVANVSRVLPRASAARISERTMRPKR